MKKVLGICLILSLLSPMGSLAASEAKITVFEPQALERVALPIDANNPIDTTSLEGMDRLLDVARAALAIVLPENTPFAVEPNRTMLRRRDNILEVSGVYRMVAADPGSPSASYHIDILHDGDMYRPLNLYLEDDLVWESENQPVDVAEAGGVFQGLLYPMKRGQQLDDVKRLQQALKELGFFQGKVVITFGEGTQIAVRQFQKANGLQNTGMADESTLAVLYGGDPMLNSEGEEVRISQEAMTIEYRPLRFGAEGTVVRRLQQALLDLGLYEGELALRFGENTENAVRAYQKAKGLPVTGVADHATQSLLYTGLLPAAAELPAGTPEAPIETPPPGVLSTPTPSGTKAPTTLDEIPDLDTKPDSLLLHPNG